MLHVFRDGWWVTAGISFAGIVPALALLRRPPRLARRHERRTVSSISQRVKGNSAVKAIQIVPAGGYDSLTLAEVPEPATAAGEALVRVTAAGVTPFDHSVLTGKRPVAKTSPVVPGGEGAGRVISDPTGRFCPGDRVVFSAGSAPAGRDGTFAERVAVDARYLTGIPDGISDEVAAGLPVAYLTAFFALRQARFAAGQSVLATGVGGSVGNATLRLAHALGASKLVSTAGSEQKLKASQQDATLPPTQVVLLTSESLADGLHRTAPEGIDVVIDALGGPLFGQALAGLATYGRAVSVGYSAGVRSEIAITDLIWKRAILSGFALVEAGPDTHAEAWSVLSPLLAQGTIRPSFDISYPLERAADALHHLIDDRPYGTVSLTIAP